MKLPFALLLAIAGTAVGATAAEARHGRDDGGWRDHREDNHGRHDRWDDRGRHHGDRGLHRGWDRHDRWVAGRYYNGRGYWDGRGWSQHRYRYNNGWRYR